MGRTNTFSIFEGLSAPAYEALRAQARPRSWPAGGMLFQRGDPGAQLLALTAGRVRLSLTTPHGRELVLRMVGPGETMGELALIDGQPRSADAMAVEPTKALVLERAAFLGACRDYPEIPMAVASYLCAQLRSTNHQMESIALYDLQTRLLRFVLFTLEQAHGTDLPASVPLRLGLNQNDLSAVLGASRPKVNQALQALLQDGALRRDEGTGLICDTARVRALIALAETG